MKKKRAQITLKGASVKDRFAHVETILNRMARRMNQKVVGVMPPSVIFQYIDKPDKEGFLIKGIIPSGKVTKICLAIKKYNTSKVVTFICKLQMLKGEGFNYSFDSHKELLVEEVNLSVNDIGFFSLQALSQEGIETIIEDIWITVLVQINQSDSYIKNLMLDEVLKLEELDEGI